MRTISEVVREVIDDYLNEELSIANDVSNYVNDVYNQVLKLNKEDGYAFFKEYTMLSNGNTVLCKYREKVFWTNGIIYEGIEVPCKITVLDFDDENSAINYAQNIDVWNNNDFNQNDLNIQVTVNGVCGKINVLLLKNVLFHEAEHAYQFYRRFGNLISSKSRYHKAVAIVQGKDKVHNSNEFQLVAHLVYFYNTREIDANANALYGELIVKKDNNINGTNFNNENELAKEEFNNFLSLSEKYNFSNEISYFDFTLNSFIKYIYHQQKYLNKKIRHILIKANKDNSIKEVLNKKPPLNVYI